MLERVLVVDAANVIGSRPDGWWRDRAGAAERLLMSLEGLADLVAAPAGDVRITGVRVVLEGQSRRARHESPAGSRLVVVHASADGDSQIVDVAAHVLAEGAVPLVVTADRGLRQRLPLGAETAGPGWLNGLLGR